MCTLRGLIRRIDPRVVVLLRRACAIVGLLIGFAFAGSAFAHAADTGSILNPVGNLLGNGGNGGGTGGGGGLAPIINRVVQPVVNPGTPGPALPTVTSPVTTIIASTTTPVLAPVGAAVEPVVALAQPVLDTVTGPVGVLLQPVTGIVRPVLRPVFGVVPPIGAVTEPILAGSPPPRPPSGDGFPAPSAAPSAGPDSTQPATPADPNAALAPLPLPASVAPRGALSVAAPTIPLPFGAVFGRRAPVEPNESSRPSSAVPKLPVPGPPTGPQLGVGGFGSTGGGNGPGPVSGIVTTMPRTPLAIRCGLGVRPAMRPPRWWFFDPHNHPS